MKQKRPRIETWIWWKRPVFFFLVYRGLLCGDSAYIVAFDIVMYPRFWRKHSGGSVGIGGTMSKATMHDDGIGGTWHAIRIRLVATELVLSWGLKETASRSIWYVSFLIYTLKRLNPRKVTYMCIEKYTKDFELWTKPWIERERASKSVLQASFLIFRSLF